MRERSDHRYALLLDRLIVFVLVCAKRRRERKVVEMPFVRIVAKGHGGFGAGASWFQHWLETDTGDFDDGEALCEGLRGIISSNLITPMSSAFSLARMDWTYWGSLGSIPPPTQVYGFTALVGGEGTTNPLAPRQTMLIEYKTLSGVIPRKRLYVGRWSEAHNDSPGVPDSTVVSAVQGYADNTIGELNVNGHAWFWTVCRLQRIVGPTGQVHYAPELSSQLSSHLVQTKWAFLRTRDIGRGI